jgi:hypothetical protein
MSDQNHQMNSSNRPAMNAVDKAWWPIHMIDKAYILLAHALAYASEVELQAIAAMLGQQQKDEGSKHAEIQQGKVKKSAAPDEPESSAEGAADTNSNIGKPPCCYRCLAKGHEKQDCETVLCCEN